MPGLPVPLRRRVARRLPVEEPAVVKRLPAWSSIGRPTPRPRHRRDRRTVLDETRLRVRSHARVGVDITSATRISALTSAIVTGRATSSSSTTAMISNVRLQARHSGRVVVTSGARDGVGRRDSHATEELLLLL